MEKSIEDGSCEILENDLRYLLQVFPDKKQCCD